MALIGLDVIRAFSYEEIFEQIVVDYRVLMFTTALALALAGYRSRSMIWGTEPRSPSRTVAAVKRATGPGFQIRWPSLATQWSMVSISGTCASSGSGASLPASSQAWSRA